MFQEEKFDLDAFARMLRKAPPELRRDRIQEELHRLRALTIREAGARFQQQIHIRRLERLIQFLDGDDLEGQLTPAEQRAFSTLRPREPSEAADEAERRESRRIAMKTRVRVRSDDEGPEEVVEPQNVSRGGLGFVSARRYQLHTIVWTLLHYRPESAGAAEQELETRGLIVRAAPLAGSPLFSYGVRYLAE